MSPRSLQRLIVYLTYLVSFAPLVLLRNFYFPFIVPKTVFFRSVVEVMALLWLVLALKDPATRPRKNSLATWAFATFLFVVMVTMFTGLDPRMSFWGDFERMWGLLTLLHFFAFFVVLSTAFEAKDWLRFFQVNLGVGSLVALYGIGQWLGLSFVEQPNVDRIIATLGNASYVGGYMLLVGAIALYLFFTRPRPERWWYGGAAGLAALALFLSVTRGAYLAAVVGAVLLLGGSIAWGTSAKARRFALWFLGAAFALGVLLIVFRSTSFVERNYYLQRLTDFNIESTTTQTRLIGWRAALKGFRERPLLGWGEENYLVVFNKHFPARFHSLAPTETYFDRAHNQFLDTLVSDGLFGFLSYLAIYVFTGALVVGLRRRAGLDAATFLFVMTALVMYFVQNFFVFDTLGPFLVFVAILAYGEWLGRTRLLLPEASSKTPRRAAARSVVAFQWLAPMGALAIFFIWFFNVRVAAASNLGAWAISLADPALATNVFEQAVAYDIPAIRDVRNTFADRIASMADRDQQSGAAVKKGLDVTLRELEKTLTEMPIDVFTGVKAMKVYNLRYALFGNVSDLGRAEELFRFLLPHSPERLEINFLGAQTALLAGDVEGALTRIERARDLNREYPDGWWFAGLIMLDAGKSTSSAVGNLKEGLRLGMGPTGAQLKRAIGAAAEVNDLEFLRDLYERLLAKEPKNAQVWASLAVTYRQLGDGEKAREAARKAAEIDPNFGVEARKFLEGL